MDRSMTGMQRDDVTNSQIFLVADRAVCRRTEGGLVRASGFAASSDRLAKTNNAAPRTK
jgi:hypothetical protein